MADPIEEEHLNSPKKNQSENPSDEIIPAAAIETINLDQETEKTEIHHHAHHEGKKWKSYLWEFLMVFLAVFCGFLAENQREYMVERRQENKYMASLLEDLVNDTMDLKRDIDSWEVIIRKTDTLRNELIQQFKERNDKLIYCLANSLNYNNDFAYHDRTIGQLKYAGNFRLIRKINIADSLVEYDAAIQTALKHIEDLYRNIIRPEQLNLQDQLLNSKFYEICNDPILFDSAIKKEPDIILIKNEKEDIVFQYYNRLYNFKRLNRNRVNWQKLLLRRAVNLIELIKQEYHLH